MRLFASCLALVLLAAPVAAQTLTVTGPAGVVTLQAEDITALPRRAVETQREGRVLRWEGPTLESVLAKVGAPLGEAARGSALAAYVVVEGADGFRTVLSLAEADPSFRAPGAVLADRLNRAALAASEGPLRLVAPADLRPTRAVRNVVSIRVETVASAHSAGQSRPPSTP